MINITGAQAQAINEARNTIQAIAQAHPLEQEARQIIRDTIASRPEFDINELLYNADEVASVVSDDLFDQLYEQRENEYIKAQVHDPEQATAWETIARERICLESDLVMHILGEMCMDYDEIAEVFACNDWVKLETCALRYLASDWRRVLEVIAEMTAESEEV